MKPQSLYRYLSHYSLEKPLFENHMRFIVGPRQTGKTTMVQDFLKKSQGGLGCYFNWDDMRVRKAFLKEPYFFEEKQDTSSRVDIVFDEIHKMRKWKSYLKGAYDSFRDQFNFIVTGSGRLDLFQRGGDSLVGRYDLFHLLPLTPSEIEGLKPIDELSIETILSKKELSEDLIHGWEKLGGFPEPFLSANHAKMDLWWEQYQIRVTEEDARDIANINMIDLMKNLLLVLPQKISSPLSINGLRESLQSSHQTIANYIKILEQLFMVFQIQPFHSKISKAVTKEKKLYFYHHPAVEDVGSKFENMLALNLLKWCISTKERGFGRYDLNYLRDQNGREVDFVILKDKKPLLLIEAKYSDTNFSSGLLYYQKKLNIPVVQVVRKPKTLIKRDEGVVVSLHRIASVLG